MNEEMFAELEASLMEGMAILRGEILSARIFVYDTKDRPARMLLIVATKQSVGAGKNAKGEAS